MIGVGFGTFSNSYMAILPALLLALLEDNNLITENGDLLVTEDDDELII